MSKFSRREFLELAGALGVSALLPDIEEVEEPVEEPTDGPTCSNHYELCNMYFCAGGIEVQKECKGDWQRRGSPPRPSPAIGSSGEGLWMLYRSKEGRNR